MPRHALRTLSPIVGALICVGACSKSDLTSSQRKAIAAEIENEVRSAYDLSRPDVVKNLQHLYADTGRLISAAGGQVVTSRDSLFGGIATFWKFVGSNMRNPQWMWDGFYVDVLSPESAVMTASYHVPHLTPTGMAHVIGGAWTAAFRKENGRWVIVQEHLSDLPPAMADSAHAHMKMGGDSAMSTSSPGSPQRRPPASGRRQP